MNAKTLTALKASIAHHERNLEVTLPLEVEIGRRYCALCNIYWRAEVDGVRCVGCPVFKRTGEHGCAGTPFEALWMARISWRDDSRSAVRRKAFLTAERAEIKFLKSLLPKGKKL